MLQKLLKQLKQEEVIGNKVAVKIVKPKPVPEANSRNVKKSIFLQRKEHKY